MEENKRPIIIWLLVGCLLIFSMVIVGGITRLTSSGLSITEWNVIMGTIPPLHQNEWQQAFEKYQQSPQFQKINFDMELSQFKSIFWWEYTHRLIGRFIGIVFIIPFFYFLFTKKLDNPLIKKLVFIFLLGGLQGFIGWYMVKSGLINNPHVSHYRLATHLITAFITYGFTFWIALDLTYANQNSKFKIQNSKLKLLTTIILLIVILQVIYGAFVAGLHAGKIYNTFPKMGNEWMPDAVNTMIPYWKNLTENLAGVQFLHRGIAWILTVLIFALWFVARKYPLTKPQRGAVNLLMMVLVFQFTLGILTLLYAVPITLAVLHQTGAFFLFSSAIFLNHQLRN